MNRHNANGSRIRHGIDSSNQRRKMRMSDIKKFSNQSVNAEESPVAPEGQISAEQEYYPEMLRDPYDFSKDANPTSPEDVISQSNCQSIEPDL